MPQSNIYPSEKFRRACRLSGVLEPATRKPTTAASSQIVDPGGQQYRNWRYPLDEKNAPLTSRFRPSNLSSAFARNQNVPYVRCVGMNEPQTMFRSARIPEGGDAEARAEIWQGLTQGCDEAWCALPVHACSRTQTYCVHKLKELAPCGWWVGEA